MSGGYPNAVLTKKPGGDMAVQLTFPDVFEKHYLESGRGYSYYPCPEAAPCAFMKRGDDLASAYHAQKRADSMEMVMAKVKATQASKDRMLVSHANFYGMPKAVLSQRVFANPSLGNQSGAIDSARRTMPGSMAPFRCLGSCEERGGANPYETQLKGGVVMRTETGREWVAKETQKRIQQLNAIDAARASDALDTGVGVRYPEPEEVDSVPFAMKSQLDLVGALGQIQNALMAGDVRTMARFTLEDITKATKLLARWSITATDVEFQEAIELLDEIKESALEIVSEDELRVYRDRAEERERSAIDRDAAVIVDNVLPRLDAMRNYVMGMYKTAYMTPKERKARSAALLKSSGLLSLKPRNSNNMVDNETNLINRLITRGGEPDPRVPIPGPFYPGDDDDDDDIGFDRPAEDREDAEAAQRPMGAFGRDQRDIRARREAAAQGEPGGGAAGVAGQFGIGRAAAQGMDVAAALREAPVPQFAAAAEDAPAALARAAAALGPQPAAFGLEEEEAPPLRRVRIPRAEEGKEEEGVGAVVPGGAAGLAPIGAAGIPLGAQVAPAERVYVPRLSRLTQAFFQDRANGADSFTPNLRLIARGVPIEGKPPIAGEMLLNKLGNYYQYYIQGFIPGERKKNGEPYAGKRGENTVIDEAMYRAVVQKAIRDDGALKLRGQGRKRVSRKKVLHL